MLAHFKTLASYKADHLFIAYKLYSYYNQKIIKKSTDYKSLKGKVIKFKASHPNNLLGRLAFFLP